MYAGVAAPSTHPALSNAEGVRVRIYDLSMQRKA